MVLFLQKIIRNLLRNIQKVFDERIKFIREKEEIVTSEEVRISG